MWLVNVYLLVSIDLFYAFTFHHLLHFSLLVFFSNFRFCNFYHVNKSLRLQDETSLLLHKHAVTEVTNKVTITLCQALSIMLAFGTILPYCHVCQVSFFL